MTAASIRHRAFLTQFCQQLHSIRAVLQVMKNRFLWKLQFKKFKNELYFIKDRDAYSINVSAFGMAGCE